MLTAEGGEGHLAAARALVSDLRAESPDIDVVVLDALAGLGPLARAVSVHGYRLQLRLAPWIYGLLYWLVTHVTPLDRLGRLGLTLAGGRSLRRIVESCQPDVVVSTYPAATNVLGALRQRGKVAWPLCATITDLGGLAFWAHPGVDAHLVMHEACIAPVQKVAGEGSAVLCRPLVQPAFYEPVAKEEARRQLGLPARGPIVVVSGGGWGAGDIPEAARACLELPGTTVVCLAGKNEPLRRMMEAAFTGEARVKVLGFTDAMSQLLAAADALVHSTGGVTSLEALVRGCPVIAYGAPPGHARLTARAMASLGLAEEARSNAELTAALRRALAQGALSHRRLATAPRAATLVARLERRHPAAASRRPSTPWHAARALRPVIVAATVVALLLVGLAMRSDDAYSLVAHALDLDPVTSVLTQRSAVALVISAPAPSIPSLAEWLVDHGAHASFALDPASQSATDLAVPSGDEVVPELEPGGVVRWLHTGQELVRAREVLGLGRQFYVLAPPSGLTADQDLLARRAGARPVVGSLRVDATDTTRARAPRRGDVIIVTLGPQPDVANSTLTALLTELAQQGLRAVALTRLEAWNSAQTR